MSEVEKIYMSWEQFDIDITNFIDWLTKNEFRKDSVILGLKRGGFPTATAISNKTDIPVSTVAFQTRDGDDVIPNFLEPDMIRNAKKIIIPDDIYDSGLTIETTLVELKKQFDVDVENIAAVFHYSSDKINETKLTNYMSLANNNDTWIAFPWE